MKQVRSPKDPPFRILLPFVGERPCKVDKRPAVLSTKIPIGTADSLGGTDHQNPTGRHVPGTEKSSGLAGLNGQEIHYTFMKINPKGTLFNAQQKAKQEH